MNMIGGPLTFEDKFVNMVRISRHTSWLSSLTSTTCI